MLSLPWTYEAKDGWNVAFQDTAIATSVSRPQKPIVLHLINLSRHQTQIDTRGRLEALRRTFPGFANDGTGNVQGETVLLGRSVGTSRRPKMMVVH